MDVGQQVVALSSAQQGLVTAAQLRLAGVTRRDVSLAIARGQLHRIEPRVYAQVRPRALARHIVSHEGVDAGYVQHVRAVLLSMGERVAAAGRTAAALRGWGLLVEPARTVELAVPHGWGSTIRRGVSVAQHASLDTVMLAPLHGADPVHLLSPRATVLDCAARLPLLQAVVVADSALRAGDVTVEELEDAAGLLPGRRGAEGIRRALSLVDPRAGSVLESVARVRLRLAGLDGFTSQELLGRDAGHLLQVDFCFREARLVVEVDGARWHPDPQRDQGRDNALAALGWRVLRYTWRQVVGDPRSVVAEVIRAVRSGTTILDLAAAASSRAA